MVDGLAHYAKKVGDTQQVSIIIGQLKMRLAKRVDYKNKYMANYFFIIYITIRKGLYYFQRQTSKKTCLSFSYAIVKSIW